MTHMRASFAAAACLLAAGCLANPDPGHPPSASVLSGAPAPFWIREHRLNPEIPIEEREFENSFLSIAVSGYVTVRHGNETRSVIICDGAPPPYQVNNTAQTIEISNRPLWEEINASRFVVEVGIGDMTSCWAIDGLHGLEASLPAFSFILRQDVFEITEDFVFGSGIVTLPGPTVLPPGLSATRVINATFTCDAIDCGSTSSYHVTGNLYVHNLGYWPRSGILLVEE